MRHANSQLSTYVAAGAGMRGLLLTPLAVLVSFAAMLLASMVWQATARLSAIRLLASHSWKHTCGTAARAAYASK
jgi:hypothetical protein